MKCFINSFNSIPRSELEDMKQSDILPSVFDLRIDNIFEAFQAIRDRSTEWSIVRSSGIKVGDICLFMCSATSANNIRMLRSYLKGKIDNEDAAFLDELCDKYDKYAGNIISIGVVDSIPDSPDRIEFATFNSVVGLKNPVPYSAFKSIITVNSFGSMTKLSDDKCKQLFSVIKGYNPDFDLSSWDIDGKAIAKRGITSRDSKIALESQNIENEIKTLNLTGKERQAFVSVRVNQSGYRKLLLSLYNHCCLCGVSDPRLLIASHIKPWIDSSGKEKVDMYNGLLLCPNHDKLFDSGFITFDEDKKIILSDQLSESDRKNMNVKADMKVDCKDECMTYMKYHREKVFDKKLLSAET